MRNVPLVWIRTKCPRHLLWPLTPRDTLAVSVALLSPARPTKTHTQEVTEWWIQHPEEQQELSQLPLHRLLTFLKVPVLGGGVGVEGRAM